MNQSSFWVLLSDQENQKTLAFICGGLVVAIAGVWKAYLHFSGKPTKFMTVTPSGGSISTSGNVSVNASDSGTAVIATGDVTITLEQYKTGLKHREQEETVLLFVYDMPNDFYTFTRLSAGYNFDTHRPMDLGLAFGMSSFLQVYKLQNPEATLESDASSYRLFSWDVVSLDPNTPVSEVQDPRIVMAVRANDAKEQAVFLRMLLESTPEPKRTLEEWFKEHP